MDVLVGMTVRASKILVLVVLSCSRAEVGRADDHAQEVQANDAQVNDASQASDSQTTDKATDNELAVLDAISRIVPPKGKLKCPDVEKRRYRGTHIRYHKPVTVNPYLQERLIAFEKIFVRVGKDVFGRAPTAIKHLGSYNCRRIRGWPHYISEHALANALDVAGFTFPRAPKAIRQTLPRNARGKFTVDMLKHWSPKKHTRKHAVFLQRVAHETIEAGIFRVVLGPSYPGHKNHLHLDLSVWPSIDVFGDSPPLLK